MQFHMLHKSEDCTALMVTELTDNRHKSAKIRASQANGGMSAIKRVCVQLSSVN